MDSAVPSSPSVEATSASAAYEKAVLAKVARRLIPFIALIYAFNILDRTNIAIASLTMKPDLGFSDTVYGLGAGLFFVGYFFFEVPSNLVLERVGARVWIARILFTWGAVSAAMLFVHTPWQFYGMRFLLGIAEAGFYPGMILYLTYWFPTIQRAQAVARFVAVSAVVGILGGPLSGLLLALNGLLGLKGWQWVFLLEGVPSCLLGFAVLRYMTDRPAQAHWLTPGERSWLMARMAREEGHRVAKHGLSLRTALQSPQLLHYAALFFLYVSSGYGLGFFVPQIFKAQTTWSDQMIAFVTALPGLAGAGAMLWGAAHSDRSCERKYHVAAGVAVGAVGIALTALSGNPFFTLAALVIVNLGNGSIQGPFWAMPTSMLTGAAAAGGIAFINSVGNLGGFAGPFVMGWLKDRTGGYQGGLWVLCVMLLGASILALFACHSSENERASHTVEEVSTGGVAVDVL